MKNRGYDVTGLGVTLGWDGDPVSHGSTWDAGCVHVDTPPPPLPGPRLLSIRPVAIPGQQGLPAWAPWAEWL